MDATNGSYSPVDDASIQAPRQQRIHPAFQTDEGPSLLLANEGQIMNRRWAAVTMICSIGAVIISTEAVTAGLAANAASRIDTKANKTSTAEDPRAIFAVAFAGFIEVALFAITSLCFLMCNYHLVYFISIGFIGVSAMGTGAYGLAVMAISMSTSVCGDSARCNDALKKGLAAACVRVLLTAPFCLAVMWWYFFKAPRERRRHRAAARRQTRRGDDGHGLEPLVTGR